MATRSTSTHGKRVANWVRDRVPLRWLLVTPAGVLVLAATALPIGTLLWLSLTDFNLVTSTEMNFIGLENYASSVVNSADFRSAVVTTVLFVVVAVTVQLLAGFLLALLLWGRPRRRKVFVPILLTPMFITWIAVGLMFRFMFESGLGIIPHLLGLVGLNIEWLSDSTGALAAIIIADIWEWIPLMMILLLAGLESLPEDPHEAARTDGANRIQMFFDVTLPMMYPVIGVAVFVRIVEASKVFPKVLAMTEGGPGSATVTVSYLIYEGGFRDFGIAAAASQAVSATLMILALLFVIYWTGGLKNVV